MTIERAATILIRRDWETKASSVFTKMDALELQAALVKLDPATTVTPIGTTMKLMPHHRVAFTVNIDDEGDVTLEDSAPSEEKSPAEATTPASRKTPGNCAANLTTHQNHHQSSGGQQTGGSKCSIAEVR